MCRLPSIATRGVYYLPWLGSGGEVLLVAVNRCGRQVLEASVDAGEDHRAAEAALWQLLEELDPPPRLRLVS